MEELAESFEGRARIVKIHVDESGEILEQFGASGIPTYLVFRDGDEVDRLRLSSLGWFLGARLRRMVEGALD